MPATGGGLWYDQTVPQRAAAMRFYADRNRECAAYWRASAAPWATARVADYSAHAARLDALADEMERTGKVLA